MNTVIIDKKDAVISFETNALKIDGQSFPYRYIDLLVLNHKISLQASDILKLTKEEINILILSHNNENISLINNGNTKNGEIKLAQYISYSKNLEFANYFIKHKILHHTEQLNRNNIDFVCDQELEQLNQSKSIDEVMGIEGAFARKYFQEYFPLLPKTMHKSRRSKRPPMDPVNAILSFWYSMYYHIITTKLLSYGFEPGIGYLHAPFRSHNALSSDLLELFRAEINEAVKYLFANEIVQLDDFTKKEGVYLKYEGRKKIWSYFVALADALRPKLDAEIANLKRMILGSQIGYH
ncbi:MAG: hypothetical protein KU28_11555 [Sulfurovum sp. PC08-66]|nr:MAG: hypothetical protein KU28_11555 [Sulfurovum sp. PC08-66]